MLPDLNEIQTDVVVVDTKVVQFELNHSGINSRMLCYDDDSTCTSAPSLVEFVDDDSSADSLSSTGNASYFSTFGNFSIRVIDDFSDENSAYASSTTSNPPTALHASASI